MGVLTSAPGRPGGGMEWLVTIELNGADGTKQTHELARGGGTDPHVWDGLRSVEVAMVRPSAGVELEREISTVIPEFPTLFRSTDRASATFVAVRLVAIFEPSLVVDMIEIGAFAEFDQPVMGAARQAGRGCAEGQVYAGGHVAIPVRRFGANRAFPAVCGHSRLNLLSTNNWQSFGPDQLRSTIR
jgi:hypothetical protein